MRIRKCDRCDRCYESYEDKFNSIGTATYNMDNEQLDVGQSYDLCKNCRDEFVEWYNSMNGKLEGTIKPNVIGEIKFEYNNKSYDVEGVY